MKRNEILGYKTIDEMDISTTQATQQKITKVNPDGTAELTDPTGKVTKVKQTDLQTDPKDPTGKKLQATISAPENQIKPGAQVNVTTATEELGYDEVNGKSASYILRKLDQGIPLDSIIDDFPELSKIIDSIARSHGINPNTDFEEIENILINELENLADEYHSSHSDSDDYYESRELNLIKKLSGL